MGTALVSVIDQDENDEIVSYLPLCPIAERMISVGMPLYTGATVNFAESVDTVVLDMKEIFPTFFFAVPRIWEKMMAGIIIKMKDASMLKKMLFSLSASFKLILNWLKRRFHCHYESHTSWRTGPCFVTLRRKWGFFGAELP